MTGHGADKAYVGSSPHAFAGLMAGQPRKQNPWWRMRHSEKKPAMQQTMESRRLPSMQ